MFTVLGQILGGVGLFLVGIQLIQTGFMESAGHSLRRILADYHDKPGKGVLSGFVVASAIQSASAVVLTLIGFINAKILSLRAAIPVVFGANLGKIMTAVILVIIGFKFNGLAGSYAMLGLGVFAKMLLKPRHAGVAYGLMGFGLIFLGMNTLRSSIDLVNQNLSLSTLAIPGETGLLIYLLIGIVMTLITQSSTGPIAITLSALSTGIVSLENACALVTGENIGTMFATLMASAGTNPEAKRLAASHVIYNITSAVFAFLILQAMYVLGGFSHLAHAAGHDKSIALVMFYASGIVMALVTLMPLRHRLYKMLNKKFINGKTLGAPRFIERSLSHDPMLAIGALHDEVQRFGTNSLDMMVTALTWQIREGWIITGDVTDEENELDHLLESIYWFATRTSRKQASEPVTLAMQSLSLASSHFETASDISQRITKQISKFSEKTNAATLEPLLIWLEQIKTILRDMKHPLETGDLDALHKLEESYTAINQTRGDLRRDMLIFATNKQSSSAQSTLFIDLVNNVGQAVHELSIGIEHMWEVRTHLLNLSVASLSTGSPLPAGVTGESHVGGATSH